MRSVSIALLACVAPAFSSCASSSGSIFTHTIEPLTTNFHQTPVVRDSERGDVKEFDYYVRVLWGTNGIGSVAKDHGFKEVYYADLETLSILGIWTQQWAHVYGSR